MTWVKLDDKLHAHPKVQRAWRAYPPALGLHLLALSHAGAYDTAGHVPELFVRLQLTAPQRRRAVQALLEAGLWEPTEGGWRIHGFEKCNPSRERGAPSLFDASRARAQARAAAGAGGRAGVPTRPDPKASSSHPSIGGPA